MRRVDSAVGQGRLGHTEKASELGYDLRSALDDERVNTQAAEILSLLIRSITIHPGENAKAEVSADVVDLMSYAALDKPEWEVRRECSVAVVAGVGFEPTTFRL